MKLISKDEGLFLRYWFRWYVWDKKTKDFRQLKLDRSLGINIPYKLKYERKG